MTQQPMFGGTIRPFAIIIITYFRKFVLDINKHLYEYLIAIK